MQVSNTRKMDSADPDELDVRMEIRPDLADLSTKWDSLVDLQPIPSPFLRSWWISNATGDTPVILCVFRGTELIGGAAFEVDQWGPDVLRMEKVRMAGGGLLAPDHLDLITAPGEHRTVSRHVLTWLLRPGNRLIDLDGLTADGFLASMFRDELVETSEAPLVELPRDNAEYVAGRPGKVRSTIKRRTKQLVAAGVTFSTAERSDLDRAITSFSTLHDLRWAELSGFLDAFERFSNVLRAASDRDEVLINELRTDSGETIAVEVDFRIGKRLFFYQAGRRTEHEWRGSGTVLRARIIERAIDDGMVEYDMLRGDEPYKAEWATTARKLSHHQLAVGSRAKLALVARGLIADLEQRRQRDGD